MLRNDNESFNSMKMLSVFHVLVFLLNGLLPFHRIVIQDPLSSQL